MVSVGAVTNELNPTEESKSRSLASRILGVAAGLSLVAAIGAGCSSSGDSTSGEGATTTAAATDDGGGGGDGCVTVTDGKITIVTENFDFQPDCIDLEGDSLDITYDNKEDGVKHDIDFEDLGEQTELKEGPNTQELKLTGLESGETYDWVCSIHSQMTGTLNVK